MTLYARGGYNLTGQLGIEVNISTANALATNRSSPVQIGTGILTATKIGNSSWSQVSAGVDHTLGIRSDGALFGWGSYAAGTFNKYSWKIAAGTDHSVATKSDGSLWTWGGVGNGQLGNLDITTYRSSPIQIGTSSWSQVGAGAYASYAIRSDGGLFAWGYNSAGQLGINNILSRSSPVQIGTSSWTLVHSGNSSTNSNTAAIRADGRLFAWGMGPSQIGQFTSNVARSSPIQIGTSSWTTVAAGTVMAAIRSDGALFSWGTPWVGVGNFTLSSPVQITSLVTETEQLTYTQYKGVTANSWRSISAGISFSAGVQSDGSLWTWGYNLHGVLGDLSFNTTVIQNTPYKVGNSSWTFVETGATHIVAIRSDGALFAWGANVLGQLGDGSTISRSSPVQLYTPMYDIAAASSFDGTFMLKIRDDGMLFGSGSNGFGELGISNTINRSSPVQIGTSSWSQVYAGGSYAMALRSDGMLFAWGDNTYGQLGIVDIIHRSSPVQVSSTSWTSIISAGRNSVGLKTTDGYMLMYGRNDSGQLGLLDTFNRSSPVQVGTLNTWQIVSAGELHSGGVKDGKIFLWGNNQYGQLGTVDTINRSSPIQLSSGYGGSSAYVWNQISCGSNFTLGAYVAKALWPGGAGAATIFSWGRNNSGQLGLSDTINRSSPVQLATSNVYGNLVTSNDYSIVQNVFIEDYNIRPSTNILSWGLNDKGQLGLGNSINRSAVVTIGSGYLTSWTLVGAAMGIPSKIPSVYAWGNNTTGRLGLNNTINVSSPTQLSTTINYSKPGSWTMAAAGYNQSLAIGNNSKIYGWGNWPATAQLDLLSRSEPVQIGTSSWINVRSSADIVIAEKPDNTLFIWGAEVTGNWAMASYGTRSSPTQIGYIEPSQDDMLSYASYTSQIPYSWTTVAAGNSVTFGIRSDKKLMFTGYSQYGLSGDNPAFAQPYIGFREVPANNNRVDSSWVKIAAAVDSVAAIQDDGSLWTWGTNQYGQLGMPLSVHRSSPVQVNSIYTYNDEKSYAAFLGYASTPQSISWSSLCNVTYRLGGGGNYQYATMGIDTSGGLWAWGTSNSSGELGNPNLQKTYDDLRLVKPNKIGSSSWTQVALNPTTGLTALAIRADGTLWVWGSCQPYSPDYSYNYRSSPIQIGTSSWTMMDSVGNFLIRADGALFGWGATNSNGVLGTSDTFNRSSPTQIGTSSWTQVTTGFAIRSDGALFAIGGLGSSGQLGLNNTLNRSSPVQIGTSSWTTLAASGMIFGNTMATMFAIRRDGALFAWGTNASGDLGINDSISRSSPVQIGTSSWTSVHADGWGITTAGALWGWGKDPNNWRIPNIPATGNKSSPVQVGIVPSGMSFIFASGGSDKFNGFAAGSYNPHFIEASTRRLYMWGTGIIGKYLTDTITTDMCVMTDINDSWTQVSGMGYTVASIRNDGAIFTWGLNTTAQMGKNNATNSGTPYKWDQSWSQVAAGQVNTFAIKPDGTLWGTGWGPGLGINDTFNRSSPVQIGSGSWSQISSGLSHTLALDTTNALYGWGNNAGAQLGLNDTIARSSPVQIGSSLYSKVVAGWSWSQAIRSDGILFAWGINATGRLGNNDTLNLTRSSPVQIGTSTWTSVAAGLTHAVGILSDNSMYAWGNPAGSALGTPRTAFNVNSPTFVSTITDYATDFATNYSAAAVIRSDGTLWTWGRNNEGQLGDGTIFYRSLPVKIGASSWTAIGAAKGSTFFFRRIDDTTFATGYNGNGNLGFNDIINRSSPTQLGTSANSWTMISSDQTFGLNGNGALYGWGYNNLGQGGTLPWSTHTSSPTFITTFRDSFTVVATAVSHAAAIRDDGRLFVWGLGTQGQLGSGNTAQSITLRNLDTRSWIAVATGFNNTSAIRSDGLLFAWGLGGDGQLGQLNSINFSSPVQIGAQSYTMLSAGNTYNFAFRNDGVVYGTGYTVNGELGINFGAANVRRSSPVQLGTIDSYIINRSIISSPTQIGTSSWSQVSAGNRFSMAIRIDNALFKWGATQSVPILTSPTLTGYPMPSPTLVGYSVTQIVAGMSNFGFLKSV